MKNESPHSENEAAKLLLRLNASNKSMNCFCYSIINPNLLREKFAKRFARRVSHFAAMAFQKPVVVSKTIPLKILVDKQRNKVAFVETTKDFVDTLFSFLSLPLATIVRLLETNNNDQLQLQESSPFFDNIKNLYQSVQNLDSNEVWNSPVCRQMLLRPQNPCEFLCRKLFMNIDDTELSNKYFVCACCYKFSTFQNVCCTCGISLTRESQNLDSENQNNAQDGVSIRQNGPMFLISDDLKIVPSSMLSSLEMLIQSGHSDLTQLEEITHNITKHEVTIAVALFYV